MQVTNTPMRYGAVSQNIHWLTAALVIVLLVMGKAGDIEAEQSNELYFWHSSLGIAVLLLVVVRLFWHLISRPPALPSSMSTFARMAARTLHVCFYLLLIALPLSGWLMASAEGAPIAFFGISISSADMGKGGEEFWEETHEVLANALLFIATLHALAALKHHLVDKDDVLRRMLPRGTQSSATAIETGARAKREDSRMP